MTKQELLEYAKKRYPKGSFYKEVGYKSFEIAESKGYFDFSGIGIFCGFGYVYSFNEKIWAQNCDQNGNIIPYIETETTIELW